MTLSVVGQNGDTATCTANVTFSAPLHVAFAHNFGSVDAELIHDIETDATGNIYVTANTAGTADFDPGAGTANATNETVVAKYASDGSLVWLKSFSGNIPPVSYTHLRAHET